MGSRTSAFLHSDWTLLAVLVTLTACWILIPWWYERRGNRKL